MEDKKTVKVGNKKQMPGIDVLEIYNRMRGVCGVKSNRELAKLCGVTAQSLSQNVARKSVPLSLVWDFQIKMEELGKEVSLDYVLKGKMPVEDTSKPCDYIEIRHINHDCADKFDLPAKDVPYREGSELRFFDDNYTLYVIDINDKKVDTAPRDFALNSVIKPAIAFCRKSWSGGYKIDDDEVDSLDNIQILGAVVGKFVWG